MTRSRVLALLALGLVVRLLGLGQWGTYDTEVQKAWSHRAATDGVADIYGPSDAAIVQRAHSHGLSLWRVPVPRTEFEWHEAMFFVDYPPASVLVLWAAGRLYGLVHPEFPNGPAFNVAINLAPLLGSLVILWLLRGSGLGELGWRRALVFWLNPAILLAVPYLGYQDTIFGALALAAVIALMDCRYPWAAALVVAAGLVKPQGALLLPTLAAVTLRESRPRVWGLCLLAGTFVAVLILMPWWIEGHLLSALDGCRRPLTQDTLAPLGLSVWWIAGYEMLRAKHGGWPLNAIVSIHDFQAWSGWDPRVPGRVLLALATLSNLAFLLRAPRADRRFIPLSVVLQVHAYALFATSVHENHTFLAVLLLPLLIGVWPKAVVALTASSAFLFASLFFAAGLGRHVLRWRAVEALRLTTVVDMSVIAAGLHVLLVLLLFGWVARTPPVREPPG
jgi:hypothetical protein